MRIDKTLGLAERLGASTARVNARDRATEILTYARRNNITQVVIGRSKPGYFETWSGRIAVQRSRAPRKRDINPCRCTRRRQGTDIQDARSAARRVTTARRASYSIGGRNRRRWLAVLVGFALERVSRLPNVSMIFLLAVLLCALRVGRFSAIAASVLSFFAYNFFFIEPRLSLTVAEPHELFALLVFLVVAVVTGGLAGRLKEQATLVRERAEATQALFDLSRRLSAAATRDDALTVLAIQSATLVKGKAVALLHGPADLELIVCVATRRSVVDAGLGRCPLGLQGGINPRVWRTSTMPSARFHFRPLIAANGPIGVFGVEPSRRAPWGWLMRWSRRSSRWGNRRLSHSNAHALSRRLDAQRPARKVNVCARHCCLRYRTISERRSPRSSAQRRASRHSAIKCR